jgi:hypothetical protein
VGQRSLSVLVLLLALILLHSGQASARKYKDKYYKFSLVLPDGLRPTFDSGDVVDGELFYDTSAKVVLMISTRQSKFQSVQDYIDCSKTQLETELKYFYSDSTLQLISCNRSAYYPEEASALLFSVSVLPYGFNTCMVYFIHHRHRDIQLSFTYKKENSLQSVRYIDEIMQSLSLR